MARSVYRAIRHGLAACKHARRFSRTNGGARRSSFAGKRELLRRGHAVTVFDNLSSGKMEHIAPLLTHARFQFVQGDLLDTSALRSCMTGMDMVYHLAANPDVKYVEGDATDKDLQQNTIATYNVLEAMRRSGVGKLAFSSTSAIYGISEVQPIPESAVARPISLYGATKLGCEALIHAFSNLFDVQCWIFRFANVVGAKVRAKGRTVISDFILRLREDPTRLTVLGNGRQAKSYFLGSECIEAMLFAVEHAREKVNVYNLGGDDSLSVSRIADLVVNAMGLADVRYSYTGGEGGWPGDVPRFRLDVTALNQLGWKTRHNSEQAVEIAIRALLGIEVEEAGACKP